MKHIRNYVIAVFMLLLMAEIALPCTTILVTKGASKDGSVFVSHSDDDELGDQRIIYVPAMDHPEGSMRPVYYDPCCFGGGNIRYVGMSRGPGYFDPNLPATRPIGFIPQVSHTYAYFDANYGVMNEHQLMIGECTDGAKIELQPDSGRRIFYSAELSRVALERCKKAREAVELIGHLIDTYGYYGTGETLLIGDPEEGWVIEMCCGTMDSLGGLWVAKKVPDGQIFAAANEFRIRDVDPDDPDMIFSANLHETAQKRGWWDPSQGKLDWLKTVSYGEYNHPYYSLRRVWRIYDRVKPSAKFSPWVEDGYTREYPFSIVPDQKLDVKDVMSLHRDHYEGTEFDMTQGLAAGPFGCPYRWTGKYDGNQNDVNASGQEMTGAWERPISVFYAGYVYVNQGRSWLPDAIGGICWFGPDKPYLTCFTPFYTGMNDLPLSYQSGNTEKFSTDAAWWAFNFVANWASVKFSYMKEDILKLQNEIEEKEFILVQETDKKAQEAYSASPELAKSILTETCISNADNVVKQWWELGWYLVQKYDDGYVNDPEIAEEVGYPEWWRKEVGYQNGPVSYQKK